MSTVVIQILGGLGLFLFGMKLMSDGIEKAAGARLRVILAMFTKNRIVGTCVGVVFTGIIQSSSAVTVMVVSFVNAGLMDLSHAIGIIYGANIGTTVTSQLVSFNLTASAPVIVFAGAMLFLFGKRSTLKKIGEIVLGFGILFVGMSMMSGSMSMIKDSPVVIDVLSSLRNPFVGILVGAVITGIVQSSSVTVSIIVLMASQGLIQPAICMYIILGCNIGACVPALLSSLTGTKAAKRAALIHLFFNIIGTIITAVILLCTGDMIATAIMGFSANAGRAVANAHTIFKIAQVLVLLPFTKQIIKLTYLAVPGEDIQNEEAFTLKYIGEHNMMTPSTAIPQGIKEIERMGTMATTNLNLALDALLTGNLNNIHQINETEKSIDFMNEEIANYLLKANQLNLPTADRKMIGGLFHVVNDIERIGDHAVNISEDAERKAKAGFKFTENGEKEIREMIDMVNKELELSFEMFYKMSQDHLQEILTLEDAVDHKEREIQDNYVRRLARGTCTAESGIVFSDLASNLERVADHATNIAFSILEEEPEQKSVS